MKCPYCNKKALWCENKEIYGRNFGKSYMVYLCKECEAYVGCHNNSDIPLGTMANEETRKMRMEAHKYFDQLWKTAKRPAKRRRTLYKQFALKFNKEVHIGQSDVEMCEKIIKFAQKLIEVEKIEKEKLLTNTQK